MSRYTGGGGYLPLSWWLGGSAIDLWFSQGKYFDTNVGDGVALSSLLSISRASTAFIKSSVGVLTSVANDTLRVNELGLLIENARTNSLLQSADFSTSWTTTNLTVTTNQAVAPDGTTTMDQLNDGAVATTTHSVNQNPTISGFSAGNTVGFSVFLKNLDRQFVQLMIQGHSATGKIYGYFDLVNGTVTDSGKVSGTGTTVGTPLIETFSGGVYRCTIFGNINTTDTQFDCYISLADRGTQAGGTTSNDRPSYTGSSKSVYAWGAQLEDNSDQGGFVSSYIPTTTATASRAGDLVTLIGNAATATGGAAMSYVCENSMPWYDFDGAVDAARNGVTVGGDPGFVCILYNNRGSLRASNNTANLDLGVSTGSMAVRNKVGFSHDTGTPIRSIVQNAGTVATDGDPTTPMTFSTCRLGYQPAGSKECEVLITRITFWNSRLTDVTLQGLTAL